MKHYDYQTKTEDLIYHFIPDINCGWDVRVSDESVFLIESDFPYLELYEQEWNDIYTGESGKFFVRMIGTMLPEHELIYFKADRDYYQELYNKYRGGLEALSEI